MSTAWTDSPIGGLLLHGDGTHLIAIDFGAPEQDDVPDDVLTEARDQLAAYFAGARRTFDLPLKPRGTAFQRQVWDRLRDIPFGETTTYGTIAADLGLPPGASRAVGAANGANPIPVVVPCHRVVGADGRLTGFAGGLERKAALLDHERPGLS